MDARYIISQNVKELRSRYEDLTPEKAADDLGISKAEYWKIESGIKEPPISLLIALADMFNVSIDYLLNHTAEKEKADLGKAELLQYEVEYPYNLLDAVYDYPVSQEWLPLSEDQKKGLAFVMEELPSEERKCLLYKFEEKMEYADIAKRMGIKASSARSKVQTALRKMRAINKWRMVKYGFYGSRIDKSLDEASRILRRIEDSVLEMKRLEAVIKGTSDLADVSVHDLFPLLSTRASNALRYCGAESLADLKALYEDGSIDSLRNLGDAGRASIERAIKALFGIDVNSWRN